MLKRHDAVSALTRWISIREPWVDGRPGQLEIHPLSLDTIKEIASYEKKYPTLRIEIGGYPSAGSPALAERRNMIVRDALVDFGVRPQKIRLCAIDQSDLLSDQRVKVQLIPI